MESIKKLKQFNFDWFEKVYKEFTEHRLYDAEKKTIYYWDERYTTDYDDETQTYDEHDNSVLIIADLNQYAWAGANTPDHEYYQQWEIDNFLEKPVTIVHEILQETKLYCAELELGTKVDYINRVINEIDKEIRKLQSPKSSNPLSVKL